MPRPPARPARKAAARHPARRPPVWLFDLDDTLHNASAAAFSGLHVAMGAYVRHHLQVSPQEADHLRQHYWARYGATLLGLVRHHDVRAEHFLAWTHELPGLEHRVAGHRGDLHALMRLPGKKYVLTNAPGAYARRVLAALRIGHFFDGLLPMEAMRHFGHWRPKPDRRMLRCIAARLGVPPERCVLVEDTRGHLRAAKEVGMHTVWLQRYGRPSTKKGYAVDAKPRSLSGLPRRTVR